MSMRGKRSRRTDDSFAVGFATRSGPTGLAGALGRKPLLIGILGTAVAVLMTALSLATLYGDREDALNHSTAISRNVVSIISKDISRNLDLYNLTLQSVVDGVHTPEVMALPPSLRRQVLFDRAASASFLGGEFYVDSSGLVAAQNDRDYSPPVYIGDRDYFLAQTTHTDGGLYISKLFRSRERNGRLSIGLSRRVAHADGTFNGVAILAIEADFFKLLLEDVDVGKRGSASILLEDGSVLARKPFNQIDAGSSLASTPVFKFVEGQVDGTFTAISQIDGTKRIYTFTHIARTPIVVLVAPSEEEILAPWKQRSIFLGTLACLLGTCFIVISWMLAFSLRERAVAQAQLVRMAWTDPLTGVSNRRVLDYRIDHEWQKAKQAKQGKTPVSILFVDVDWFKIFNDTYGHAVGDSALVTVAQCVRNVVRRPGDVVARYGGEEFVALLPGVSKEAALAMAENIRLRVADAALPHAGSPVGIVTVSIGCASAVPSDGIDALTTMGEADQALYAAKNAGRNRIMSLEDSHVFANR